MQTHFLFVENVHSTGLPIENHSFYW